MLTRATPPPLACAATCQASVDVQRMSVRAAMTGDLTLLKQAMLHDPLVGAVVVVIVVVISVCVGHLLLLNSGASEN